MIALQDLPIRKVKNVEQLSRVEMSLIVTLRKKNVLGIYVGFYVQKEQSPMFWLSETMVQYGILNCHHFKWWNGSK